MSPTVADVAVDAEPLKMNFGGFAERRVTARVFVYLFTGSE
ncbi:hypothetical protein [Cryobacterium sp. TMT1-66-1]|nr:hypothetical protein [Cryobacterium sp. TMT1-66-1]